jgi:hypothetical protein
LAQLAERKGVIGSRQNQRLRRLSAGRTTNFTPPFDGCPT